jgi:glycosyltransferase involved in cell wall biosynthesis
MMPPPVAVIIPTYAPSSLLERTLESLTACRLPRSYERLIVVENGTSSARARSLVEQMPKAYRAQYERIPQGNKSKALNAALEDVEDHSLTVFFDDDIRMHPNVLSAYAEAGAEHGPGAFFGGPVRVDREREPADWLVPFLPSSAQGYDLIETRMGNRYLGFNWAAFAGDVKRLGGFNTRLGPGSASGANGDEIEMQGRMAKAGMEGIDVKDALVWHYVPAECMSFGWLLERQRQGGMRTGVKSEKPPERFALDFAKNTLISLGVAAKGMIHLDMEKVLFTLFNSAQRLGVAEGYLWSRRRERPDFPD